jgi:hypothetical protein
MEPPPVTAPLTIDTIFPYLNDLVARPYSRIAQVGKDPLPEVEVTAEVYDHFLGVLPPGYLRGGGFYVIERITGDVVSSYYRRDGKFFHRYIDLAPDVPLGDYEDDAEAGCTAPGGHSWVTQDGDDVQGEGRTYCEHCGADGDA